MKKGLYILLVLLLVVAFGASALYLGSYFLEGKKEADRYNELSAMVETSRQDQTQDASEPSTQTNDSPFGVPGQNDDPDAYYTGFPT